MRMKYKVLNKQIKTRNQLKLSLKLENTHIHKIETESKENNDILLESNIINEKIEPISKESARRSVGPKLKNDLKGK